MDKCFLVLSIGMMLMLSLGCVQEGGKINLTSLPNISNIPSLPIINASAIKYMPSAPANSSAADRLSMATEQLLEINMLFLEQTKDAEAAASELNFSLAGELFNQSSASGRNLTILLDEVCRLKGKNCTTQVEGYANIAVCAHARGDFYQSVDGLMPIILLRLNCTREENVTDAEMSQLCQANEAEYKEKCVTLRRQAGLADAICQPVMPQANMWQASELLCKEA